MISKKSGTGTLHPVSEQGHNAFCRMFVLRAKLG